jgi:MFS family permease
VTFGLAEQVAVQPGILNNLTVGLFILPYFIFSALAGQLADKFEKATQIRWIKLWEVGLALLGALGFYLSSFPILLAVICGLGLQSTFFGPIKYGILPDLMSDKELLGANAAIEGGTFIAVLLGTIIGTLAVKGGEWQLIAVLTISVAAIGTLTGTLVPKTGAAAPDLKITKNIFASTRAQLKNAWGTDLTRWTIIGISWIWAYGSISISQFPVIVKDHLGGDPSVVTLFMTCFSVGIGFGSFLCSRLLKGAISARLAYPALTALTLIGVAIFLLIPEAKEVDTLMTMEAFISIPLNWIMLSLLVLAAIFAGMVIVPFYAILQHETARQQRSRMIAANNIINSGFMATGAIIAAILLTIGLTTPQVMLITGLANLAVLPSAKRLNAQLGT